MLPAPCKGLSLVKPSSQLLNVFGFGGFKRGEAIFFLNLMDARQTVRDLYLIFDRTALYSYSLIRVAQYLVLSAGKDSLHG